MSRLFLMLFLFIGLNSSANDGILEKTFEYSIDSVESNSTLSDGKSKVVIRVMNANLREGSKILYGYEDESLEAVLNSQNTFSFELNSCTCSFQFYPSRTVGYKEITTRKITVKSRTTTYITINFNYSLGRPDVVKKPVIYLYPQTETEVTVAIKPKGELSFTYPEYDGSWKFTATPSGDIRMGENSYNYLFWEAEQHVDKEKLRETASSVILKDDLVEFLEKSLNQFGFTPKEQMDFITFWAPQMIQHEATEIRFILNEECEQFAELEILPEPNNILRFYIIWNSAKATGKTSTPFTGISNMNRDGFTVLEWGGLEISPLKELSYVESEK